MKIKKLSFWGVGVMSLLALNACSDSDNNATPANPSHEKGEENYIAVNIIAANASTRAVDDNENYEDGQGVENTVNVVRLYFFNEQGNPFVVNSNGSTSYSYVNVTSGFVEGGNQTPNVEKIITATAQVTLPTGEYPSQIIAVINPGDYFDDLNLASLSDVAGAININTTTASFDTTNPEAFVMSSSVYSNGVASNPQVMETAAISAANFFTAADAAQANPVTIYVERTIGKVSVTTSLAKAPDVTGTLYDTGKTYNGNPIYVKFLGWNVTATADKSYLMKNINPAWPGTLFGQSSSQPWNYADFFRCFWALNPSDVEFNYYPFGFEPNSQGEGFVNSENENAANAITGFATPGTSDPANYTYIPENAANNYNTGAGANHPSQVIVAAQLCNADGSPLTIAEWGYGQYDITGLTNIFLSSIRTNLNPWKATETGYAQIDASDIEFVTAMSLNENLNNWEAKGRYYVYAQLTETAAGYKWYKGQPTAANAESNLTYSQINQGLEALGHAKIWNNGFTYYYFDIRHLGSETSEGVYSPGYFGVVRNHVYKCKIESLTGLGTPVYDPEETIYPEKPLDEDTYIGAKINILSWRIVSQNVSFAW